MSESFEINYNTLSQEEKRVISDLYDYINLNDSAKISQFGNSIQEDIYRFSKKTLDKINQENVEEVGKLFEELEKQVKDFDTLVPKKIKYKGLFEIFFNTKNQIEKMINKYNTVEENITKLEKKLETQKIKILKNITILDSIYEKSLEQIKKISLHIIAGEKKIEELRNITLLEFKEKTEENGEELDILKVNNMLNIFEKRIESLKTTKNIFEQIVAKTKIIQTKDNKLVDDIQSLLTSILPLWKNQIVITFGGAEETERNFVNIESLQKINKDILDTLNKIIEEYKNEKIERENIEKEILSKEEILKEKN